MAKKPSRRFGPGKMKQSIQKPWICYAEFVKTPSPGRYRCVLPVPGKIVVGRETRLGKRNQGDDRPRKQNNIAMATGTFSEVQ